MNATWKVVGCVALGIIIGVVTLPAANQEDVSATASNPTFTKDVLPILQRSCQNCHRPGTPAPMALLTYEDVRPWARAIKARVVARYMPPWHTDRTVGEYDPDPSLTDAEIATIAKWVDTGTPRGNPADAPPPVQFPDLLAWQYGQPDLVVTSPGFDVTANGPDLYPGIDVETGLTEDRYIKWVQVMPEEPKVLHHVVVNAIQDAPVNGDRSGRANPQSSGTENTSFLTQYGAGDSGDIFVDGTGKFLQAGAKLHLELHYHPNGNAIKERMKVGLKFYPKGYQPKQLISTVGITSQATLIIPPGDPNARSDAYFTLADAARLVSFMPHMHFRGKRMTLEAIPPSGPPQLLTDVNRFTWAWQITYPYKNPPTFPKGTVLHVTAYHDNSSANRDNPDPSAFVGWGARTVDEMNIGYVDYYYISDQEYADLQKEQASRSRVAQANR